MKLLTTIPHYVVAKNPDELMVAMANIQQEAKAKFAFNILIRPDGSFIAWYEYDLLESTQRELNND